MCISAFKLDKICRSYEENRTAPFFRSHCIRTSQMYFTNYSHALMPSRRSRVFLSRDAYA